MKITGDTIVKDIIGGNKEIAKVFKKYNLECLSCRGIEHDTVRIVAVNNGLDPDEFLKELKEAEKKGKV